MLMAMAGLPEAMYMQLKLMLQPRYLTIKEAMFYLGIRSRTTFNNKVIDYVEVYDTPFGMRFKKSDLDNYMDQFRMSKKLENHRRENQTVEEMAS
ncbi:hypothetical protein M3M39_05070 [Fructilactobacillus hinvesii]|uniref:Helix-turn-helix domain-containing protein n=1 Tax=Fructilactobacillus hinvesii TaxID=2940300 RepID=A0ABY5BRA2_9LACO|nr:hypothetical protein [Fructilactobacillus hinvesii]USS87495.1 hypothetical protein M3M39_05070 [Fructilactobacillus hinvesii]